MTKKSIAILLPTHNAADHLKECLDSVLAQTRQPEEIVICDDISSDKTWDILLDYESRHKGLIRLLRNDTNLGLAGNRQRLLESTQCDLVKFFDDDDILDPHFLELMAPLLESGKYDLAACAVLNFNNNDTAQLYGDFPMRSRQWDEPPWAHHIALAGHLINKIHDRKFLMDAGGFTGLYGPAVDFNLDLRLMRRGARLAVLAENLILHRGRERSRTFTHDKLMFNAFHFFHQAVQDIEKMGWLNDYPAQRKILADRLWHMGRLLTDSGQIDTAMEAFAASRKLLPQGIVHGSRSYKIIATFFGLRFAENLRLRLSKIKK